MATLSGILKSAGAWSALIGIVTGAFSLWFFVENRITTAVKTGTEVVTKDVQAAEVNIIGVVLQDMKLRLHLVDTEILSLKEAGQKVPERMTMHRNMLASQIEDIEKKWLKSQTP